MGNCYRVICDYCEAREATYVMEEFYNCIYACDDCRTIILETYGPDTEKE